MTFALAISVVVGNSRAAESKLAEGLVFVKGGCFEMGDTFGDGAVSERPVHTVCLSDFYIDKYLVTQSDYKARTGANPSNFAGCPNCPVESVTWSEANKYCTEAGKRLPTEAEWEYAARSGGKKEKIAGMQGDGGLGAYAWFFGNSEAAQPYPVGLKKPNGLGLYDMSGNVWEWVGDRFDKHYYDESPKDDPKGPDHGDERAQRGGSWTNNPKQVRTTARSSDKPDGRLGNVGFRCAK